MTILLVAAPGHPGQPRDGGAVPGDPVSELSRQRPDLRTRDRRAPRRRPRARVTADRSTARHERAVPPVVAVLLAITPLVVATVRALSRGWVALGDNGLILLRAEDVATANHPLLGTWTSASLTAGRNINNPGPLWFDVLAPFVRIGGPSVGLAVGVMAANIIAIVGAAWAGASDRRRPGPGPRSLPCPSGLAWAMGSELLFDAWQPHVLILPFWALLVMSWGLSAGDLWMSPFVAGIASLLVQTHLTFVYVLLGVVAATIAIGAAGVAWRASDPAIAGRASSRRYGASDVDGGGRRGADKPLVDQFAGEGNLADLVASSGGTANRIGLGLGDRSSPRSLPSRRGGPGRGSARPSA